MLMKQVQTPTIAYNWLDHNSKHMEATNSQDNKSHTYITDEKV